MLLANREFNHKADTFHQSLGIDDNVRILCRERIYYTAFKNALKREELKRNGIEVPDELSTVSGDLQSVLRSISDQLEYEYTLMIFNFNQRVAIESFSYWQLKEHMNETGALDIKFQIMEMIENIKKLEKKNRNNDADENMKINQLDKTNMIKRIEFTKKSNYSFHRYLKQLNEWTGTNISKSVKTEVDDMLKKLFSSDHE